METSKKKKNVKNDREQTCGRELGGGENMSGLGKNEAQELV